MLHILWMLLKIIGIILLIILGLLVLSICVIFFVPLRYCGKAKANGTLDSVNANLKFSWFLHLVSGYITYENRETKWQVRILWKNINVGEDKSKNTISKDMTSEEEFSEEGISEDRVANNTTAPNENDEDKEIQPKKKKKNIFNKIKYTFSEFCDKIKSVIRKKESLQEFLSDEVHQLSFMKLKKEVCRLLRFLKPKKLILNLHFGFEDPALTGKILGALCTLYPFYMDHVNLEPEFEKKILEGDAYMKGTLRGFRLLIVICNLVFDKNIKSTYKAIKNWKR